MATELYIRNMNSEVEMVKLMYELDHHDWNKKSHLLHDLTMTAKL